MKRYKNAEVFLAALNSTQAQSENDMAIMQSYDEARGSALTFVCNHLLRRVTVVDQQVWDTLDAIFQAAVKFWLEACCQPYRLFVIIPEGSTDVLRSGQDLQSLQLVTRPDLQRFGNLRGTNLKRGEFLSVGWKSQVKIYPI